MRTCPLVAHNPDRMRLAPTSWLTVYRGFRPDRVGIFLSCHRDTAGAYAKQAIIDEWNAGGGVKDELGGTVRLGKTALGSMDTIIDSLQVESLEQPEERKKAFFWLAERANTFVNVLRPRVRSAAADYQSANGQARVRVSQLPTGPRVDVARAYARIVPAI